MPDQLGVAECLPRGVLVSGAFDSVISREGVAVGNEDSACVCGEDFTETFLGALLSKWGLSRQLQMRTREGAL